MRKRLLLWHPRVHEFYNETLYYFALRFRGYNRDFYNELRSELNHHGIVGICLYEIFGQYDVLLRAWLTPRMFSSLVTIFRDTPELLSNSVFRVSHQRHWAFLQEPDESVFAEVISERNRITSIQEYAKEGKEDKLSEYKDAHIIHYINDEVDVTKETKEKFYTALSFRRDGNPLSIGETKLMHDTIFNIQATSSQNTVDQISIYIGEGQLCQALMKGICSNGMAARDFIVDIVMQDLRSFSPEATTFIIGERDPYERDSISDDALNGFLTGTPPLWIDSWFDTFYRLGSDVSKLMNVQAELTNYRETITHMISTENRQSVIKPFLEGVLTENPETAIGPLLLWFARFENTLKTNWDEFFRMMSGLEGAQVGNAERDLRKDLKLLVEQVEVRKRTLGDWLNMYYTALKRYDTEAEMLKITPQLAEITEFRNEFAHGAMFGDKFTQEWKRVLALLIWALPWYEGLQKLILKSKIGRGER